MGSLGGVPVGDRWRAENFAQPCLDIIADHDVGVAARLAAGLVHVFLSALTLTTGSRGG